MYEREWSLDDKIFFFLHEQSEGGVLGGGGGVRAGGRGNSASGCGHQCEMPVRTLSAEGLDGSCEAYCSCSRKHHGNDELLSRLIKKPTQKMSSLKKS